MGLLGIGYYVSGILLFASLSSGHTADAGNKRFLLTNYHWGSWTPQSTTCSSRDCLTGSIERQRRCYSDSTSHSVDVSQCTGSDIDLIICPHSQCGSVQHLNNTNAVNGQWSAWSTYSTCSHTCGHGYRYRTRTCTNPPPSNGGQQCHGSHSYGVSCTHANACPTTTSHVVNGQWSEWSNYSACSHTCGTGFTYRHRTCTNPAPSGGGDRCHGSSSVGHTCYHTNACTTTNPTSHVVNGHWSTWGSYSSCSASCGSGMRTRHRTCTNPAPSGGGHSCTGSSVNYAACYNQCTAAWTSWAQWSSCSVSCDMGVITRHRTCNQHGTSTSCPGNVTETHECSPGPCAEWSHWFEGDCSVTCGDGTMERLRHCSTGRPQDCTGKDYEMVPCSNPICI